MTDKHNCLGWVVTGTYMVIIIECITMGILGHSTLIEIIHNKNIDVFDRDTPSVIVVTFVSVSLFGWIVSICSMSHGVQTHSSSSLIPYLVWRILFTTIIIVSAFVQTFFGVHSKKPKAFSGVFHNYQLIVAGVEVLVGLIFFVIVYRAYKEFSNHRLSTDSSFTNE